MADYYDTLPGVYRDYQDYFGKLEFQDNEFNTACNDEWQTSPFPRFNWEAVVSRFINDIENAKGENEMKAIIAKYNQTVIDIACNRLSNDYKAIINALLKNK